MSEDSKRRFSDSLVLGDSEEGVIITGITDETVAAKSGLQAGDEIVAATIHLDHLDKTEVMKILKVLEPYDNNMKVLTKKELGASAELGSLGLDPAEMLNIKQDLSVDTSADAPVVSLDGLSGKLNGTQGLGGDITGPTVNGDLPSLRLNKPSDDAAATLTMPSLGLRGPDVSGDVDGTLKTPNVSVATPPLNTPSASLNIETPEMKSGDLKYKAPKFAMPNFNLPQHKTRNIEMDVSGGVDLPSVGGNLETPDLNLSVPKLDIKSPDLDLNGPKVDLNGPDVNLETPNAGIEAHSGKINWPHLKWKGPKVKGPEGDLNADLTVPDASLSTTKIDGALSAPDVDIDLTEVNMKAPDLDVQSPNIDIDAPSTKINWPHLKWKKNKLNATKADLDLNTPDVDVSVPKVEGGINAPDVDINLPQADLKSPDLDIQAPNIDVEAPSGKINWPHLKWKKPRYSKPDLDIDADLKTPDLNVSTPKIDSDINVPNAELNLPKADLQGPAVDVQTPDLDIDSPSGKINWPHLKWKKPKLHAPGADADISADLSTPDVDLSVPKNDGEISTPDVDLNLTKGGVNVKAPDADIEAPSTKIKFPTIKKPKFLFSGPKVKSPDVDLDANMKAPDLSLSPNASLDVPDVDLNVSTADVDVKAPNVEIDTSSKTFKWPTLRKPKWSLSGPKVNGPDVDLDADVSAPDLSLSAPSIDASEVNLNLPKADLESPNLDVDAPDIDGPSGKFKWFNFKKPKFGTLKGPKADIDADVNMPDVDLKVPDVDLSSPDVKLSAPNIDGGIEAPDLRISMPNTDVKGPDVDLNGPHLDLDPPDGKFKLPKFKLPNLKGPKVKGPELDANLKAPDIDVNPDLDLNAPDLSLSAPTIKGNVDAPDLDINLPKADIKGPGVDIQTPEVDASAGKIKLPKMKMPKFGFSGPKVKGPGLDVDADLKTSDLDVSVPTLKGDLTTPDLDLDADLKTEIDLTAPKSDISLPKLNLSTPEIKDPDVSLPKADLSSPKIDTNISAPNIDAKLEAPDVRLNAPDVDINLPTTDLKGPDAQLKTPDLDIDSGLGDFKLPHFKLPKFGLSGPGVEVPSVHPSVESEFEAPKVNIGTPTADASISAPAVDMSIPKVEGDIKAPHVDVKAPTVDANIEKSKLPHFKLPKFHLPGSTIKAPEVDTSTNLEVSPDLNVKVPSVEGGISSPHVSASAPEVNTPQLDVTAGADAEGKGSPKSKLRWPFKWGFKTGSSSDDEGSGVDSETDVGSEVVVPEFKVHKLPRSSIDGIGGIGDTLSLSKVDIEEKDYVVSKGIRLPIVNTISKAGGKIDIMERLKMAKEKVPSANVSPTEEKTDIDLKLVAPSLNASASAEPGDSSFVRGGTFKIEKPESGLGLEAPKILTSDDNDKLSLSLSNMLGLNIKDSDAD